MYYGEGYKDNYTAIIIIVRIILHSDIIQNMLTADYWTEKVLKLK